MRIFYLLFFIVLINLISPETLWGQGELQVKLIQAFHLNGLEQKLKAQGTFQKSSLQVIGKGKSEPSPRGSVGAFVVTHIHLKGKKALCALKIPQITPFAHRGKSLSPGQTLSLVMDLQVLKEALHRLEQGNPRKETPPEASLTYTADRRVEDQKSQEGFQNKLSGKTPGQEIHPKDPLHGKGRLGSGKRASYGAGYGFESQERSSYGTQRSYREGGSSQIQTSQRRNRNDGKSFGQNAQNSQNVQAGKGSHLSSDSQKKPTYDGSSSSADINFGSGRRSQWAHSSLKPEARPQRKKKKSEPSPQASPPQVTVEVTTDGCEPLVDKVHHRVFILSRSITRENGRIKSTSPCEKTLEFYPLERDYHCEGCQDRISSSDKQVYPQYKSYWITAQGQKIWIDSTPQVDRENAYAFMTETDTCKAEIDLESLRAYPQHRIVYLDRWNTKKEIKSCHRIPHHQGYPITWTEEGCSPYHEFPNKRSKLRQKAVFHGGSQVHEASPCQVRGDWIPHEFIKAQCQPLMDLEGLKITPTGLRQIKTPRGSLLITHECEPLKSIGLKSTTQGCEDKFFHDWNSGRSYFKERYYYEDNHNPIFVSRCLRLNDFVPHQMKSVAYAHVDGKKISYPLQETWIHPPQGKRKIFNPNSLDSEGIPYIFVREEERMSSKKPVESGVFKSFLTEKVKLWKRADGTLFKEIGKSGSPLRQEGNFKTRLEMRQIPIRTVLITYKYPEGGYPKVIHKRTITSGKFFGRVGRVNSNLYEHSRTEEMATTYYAHQQCEVKTYSNGHEEKGKWMTTGESFRS